MASFISTVSAPAHAEVLGGHGLALPVRSDHHAAQPLAHVGEAGGQARMAMISLATAMSKPVERVKPFSSGPCPIVMPRSMRSLVSSHAPPGDGCPGSMSRRAKRERSSGVRSLGLVFSMPSLLQAAQHDWARTAGCRPWRPGKGGRRAPRRVCVGFVEHAGVDGGGQEIVGRRDGVDVARSDGG